jgi:hypothetical protein
MMRFFLVDVLVCLLFVFKCPGVISLLPTRIDRRTVGTLATGTLVCIVQNDAAFGASPVNPGEAIRRSAANIPGFGQSDVFYPPFFLGNWRAKRTILSITTRKDGNEGDLTLEYSVRFLPSIEDNAVVADRGWNQANLEMAIQSLSAQKSEASPSESSLAPSYQWTETNPNDLRLTFADGSRKEIKVTKRAVEKTGDGVFSSEFQRVTQEDSRGIPIITARRVMSKYKVVGSNIEGIEIVYDAGGGDPLAGPIGELSSQPKVLSKSRLLLERMQ